MRQYTSATIVCHISPASVLTGATDVYMMIMQDATGHKFCVGTLFGLSIDAAAGTVSYTMSRDESNAFQVGPAFVQVRGKTGNTYWGTSLAKIMVERILDAGYEEFSSSSEGGGSVAEDH